MTREVSAAKMWVTPRIEEVALEAEEDVLASCFTTSMTDKSWGGASNQCNGGGPDPCPTWP